MVTVSACVLDFHQEHHLLRIESSLLHVLSIVQSASLLYRCQAGRSSLRVLLPFRLECLESRPSASLDDRVSDLITNVVRYEQGYIYRKTPASW